METLSRFAPKAVSGFRERFDALCRSRGAELGRKLLYSEVMELGERAHNESLPKKREVHADAEKVYELYPKKVGREAALVAITKALKKNSLEYLMDKTHQFSEAVASWPSSYRYASDGRDFCPHPSTWFNAGRYADDPHEWRKHGAKSAAPHQKINIPEPKNWRAQFPDFVNREKQWGELSTAEQQFIHNAMDSLQTMTAPLKEVEQERRLRNA